MDLYGVEKQQLGEQCFLLKAPDTSGATLRRDSVTWSRAWTRYRDGSEPLRSRDSNTTTKTTHQVGCVFHTLQPFWIHNLHLTFSLLSLFQRISCPFHLWEETEPQQTWPVPSSCPLRAARLQNPLFLEVTLAFKKKIHSDHKTTALLCLHSTDEFLPLCRGKTWRSAGLGSQSHAGSEHKDVEQLSTTTDENVAANGDSVLQQSQFSGRYSQWQWKSFIFIMICYDPPLHLISNLFVLLTAGVNRVSVSCSGNKALTVYQTIHHLSNTKLHVKKVSDQLVIVL